MEPAVLNRMLEGRVKDLASVKRGLTKEDLDARRAALEKAAGLHPSPPRTEMKVASAGVIARDGYRIEKLRYEAMPGEVVTAHLYLPEAEGKHPLVVSAHGSWPGKKAAAVVQARGIAFALQGFACLIVDAPGASDADGPDERAAMGSAGERELLMGSPAAGVYAWDLIRGAELGMLREDIDAERVAITGEGNGGIAAALAFAVETRFVSAVLVCTVPSMEQRSLLCIAELGIPGIAVAGDFADMLAVCCPRPVMLLAARNDSRAEETDIARTAEKLRDLYKGIGRSEAKVRYQSFEGAADYNRRMREAAAAFFDETLRGQTAREYLPEPRPLTDGAQNPYPSGTVPMDEPELLVGGGGEGKTLRQVLEMKLAHPYPEALRLADRLAAWLKYASVAHLPSAASLGLHDVPTVSTPRVTPSIALPYEAIDMSLAAMAGLSVPEFFAQVLHLALPGRPETWEGQGLSGDVLTSMVASMKTLFSSGSNEPVPARIIADGPVASLTARFLKLYRPSLEVDASHSWTSWAEVAAAGVPQLIQPQARYLEWPF